MITCIGTDEPVYALMDPLTGCAKGANKRTHS